MSKELKKLMKKNHFVIIRQNNKAVWKHISGAIVYTSLTPSCKRALKNIQKDIKHSTGVVYA